jgi:NAD(P)-dependent dehydrogenase (short-subunit alcohol dehydrogenase family)
MSLPAAEIFDVAGRRVVVTGAGSGLGLTMATVLARSGADVMLADIDAGRLETAAAGLADAPGRVATTVVDIADYDAVRGVMAAATELFGGVDVVFGNAGIAVDRGFGSEGGGLPSFDPEVWARGIAVNLTGAMYTLKAAADAIAGPGRIVMTASNAGIAAESLVGYSYAAAKAGIIHIVKQAALELAPRGILVNAIAPGPFYTGLAGGTEPGSERAARWEQRVPLGRMAQTAEVRGLALLLASEASSFITGDTILIDGGHAIA